MAKDVNGYEFGVCELNLFNEPINLEILEDYECAYKRYLERLSITNPKNFGYIDLNLWIVWIKDNIIIQREQLNWNIKCKSINIRGGKYVNR